MCIRDSSAADAVEVANAENTTAVPEEKRLSGPYCPGTDKEAKLQVDGGLRNRRFRLRVWIFDGQFGTVLEHVWGSPPLQSRGASPPDPSRNL